MPSMLWRGGYEPDARSARRARADVGRALEEAGLPAAIIGDALLILGEITSNAVRHARTEFTITVRLADGTLRLEVFDRDSRPPSLLGQDADSTSGRGLQLVSAIATDWGWNSDHDEAGVAGKVVWAQLRTDG